MPVRLRIRQNRYKYLKRYYITVVPNVRLFLFYIKDLQKKKVDPKREDFKGSTTGGGEDERWLIGMF